MIYNYINFIHKDIYVSHSNTFFGIHPPLNGKRPQNFKFIVFYLKYIHEENVIYTHRLSANV